MKLPVEVWILGHRFAVSHGASPSATRCHEELYKSGTISIKPTDDWLYGHGMIDMRDDWIGLDTKQSVQYQRETLLHEIFHGIDHMLVDDKNRDKHHDAGKNFLTEGYVLAMSRGLFATMNDPRNDAVRDFIFPALSNRGREGDGHGHD